MDDVEVARLESIAQQFVARVHEDDPEANLRWLRAQLGVDQNAPITDTERLLFALAVAVPDNQSWRQLTSWVYSPEEREEYRRRYHREWQRIRRRVAAEQRRTTSHPPDGVAA